ncbi:hypothetical protein GALMADRAFT_235190 [Galerina marginata CBS 339.88]|uniref:RING-type domain-containing protein n=1 Tax=Galerina marginata (strain CBS 339.88) TaxID=685588 RepID=A0A067U3L0_GALM3|nr:hypothetical protein GALMADRAFT_235190 [Galerina marginata CBS 339.88]
MECQICVDDLGDRAYCLPCGHIYCLTCVGNLQQTSTRFQSIECPVCRRVVPARISSDNIRKVFLNPSSPPPQVQSIQVRLATRDRELEKLKAKLAEAQALLATVLEAKEKEISEVTQKFLHLTTEYQEEVAEHRRTRNELRTKEVEIKTLKSKEREVIAQPQPSPSPFTFTSTSILPRPSFSKGSSSILADPTRLSVNPPVSKESFPRRSGSFFPVPLSSQSTQLAEPERVRTRANITTPLVSQVRKVKLEPPKEREKKTGAGILWRGYGCPQKTPVPECTASDGYHYFSGTGTNQYSKRYTCNICRFSCSESKRN